MDFARPYLNASAYSGEVAFYAMGMSALSYMAAGSWQSDLQALYGLSNVSVVPMTNSIVPQALKCVGPHGTTIAIAGTTTIEQVLLYAFNSGVIPCAGFSGNCLQPFELYAQNLFLALKDGIDKATPLFITGHSLGGGLATILAAKFAAGGWNTIACYTFGAPRVGDRAFMDANNVWTHRVMNQGDVVTNLPHPWFEMHINPSTGLNWLPNMCHVGVPYQYSMQARFNSLWQGITNFNPLGWYATQTSTSWQNHGRGLYLSNIYYNAPAQALPTTKPLRVFLNSLGVPFGI